MVISPLLLNLSFDTVFLPEYGLRCGGVKTFKLWDTAAAEAAVSLSLNVKLQAFALHNRGKRFLLPWWL